MGRVSPSADVVSPLSEFMAKALRDDEYTVSSVLRARIDYLAEERNERLSVRQLADDSGMSSSRVTATLTGQRVPNRDELDLLCMALGLQAAERKALQRIRTHQETKRVHQAGRRATEAVLRQAGGQVLEPGPPRPRAVREVSRQPVPAFGQPDPIRVSSPEELVQALNAVLVWGGSPSLRELEKRSKGLLRRSTISDMLRSDALPDYDRYVAFLRASGIDGDNLGTWVFVWRRLKALEAPGIASWMPGPEGFAS
ncbi:helix-turn-helix domain-containing protein [Streptomyces sp. NPDC059618]|uniref:helix-turn-helix domain-containing protein n=1 Tax=Streptomyces sp. NPDC059618 TaxID=3346887 RepID=UPI003699B490